MGDEHQKHVTKNEQVPEGAEKATEQRDADDTPDVEGHIKKTMRGQKSTHKSTMRG